MLGRHVKLAGRFLIYKVEQVASYNVDFVIGVFGTILVRIGSFLPIWVVLGHVSSLSSWTLPRIALLYGFAATVRGIHHFVFTGMVNFENHVRQGTLDILLTRPVNTLLQVYGQDIQLDGFGDLLMGWGFIAYSMFAGALGVDPWTVGWLIYFVLCASFIFSSLSLAVGATAVWSYTSLGPVQVLFQLFNLVYYPVDVYQGWTRRVLTGFLPFTLLSYYPTVLLLGGSTPPLLSLWAGAVALCFYGLAYLFWSYALARYSSTGS